MRTAIAPFLAATWTTVYAQVIVNPTNGTFDCQGSAAGQNFCAGPSLASPIIIRCVGTVDVVGNCDDDLAGIAPAGVKDFAPCYQPSSSGGAVCSYEGIGYPDNGTPFNISNNAPIATLSSSSSSSIPTAISSTSTTSTTTSPIPSSVIPPSSTTTTTTLATSSTSSTTTPSSPTTTPSSAVASNPLSSTASGSTTIVYVYPTPSETISTTTSSTASSTPSVTPFQGGAAKVVGMWVPVALCMLGVFIV